MHVLALATARGGSHYRVTLQGSSDAVPAPFVAAMGGWRSTTYRVLTLGAFAILGTAPVTGSTERRLGWDADGLCPAMPALFAVLGDLPPLLCYLVSRPVGVWMVRLAGRVAGTKQLEGRAAGPRRKCRRLRGTRVTRPVQVTVDGRQSDYRHR